MKKQTILELQNIGFSYDKKTPILHNITFSIKEKSITVIGGKSGCGKSTILKLIAGFEQPDAGEIYINSHLVANEKIHLAPEKRKTGILFQEFALFPKMNIEQNIMFVLDSRLKKKEKQSIVAEILERVKLHGANKKYPYQLSIGQMQRAALARVLVLNPRLLLLDEPFSNLDKGTTFHLIDELQEILLASTTALLYVTHESLEALYLADTLMLIHDGQISQQGSPEYIYDSPHDFETAKYFDEVNFLPVIKSPCKQLTTPCGFIDEQRIENYPYIVNKNSFTLCVRPHMLQIKSNRKVRYQQANWVVKRKHFMGTHHKVFLQSKHPSFVGYEIIILQKLEKDWPKTGEIVQIEFSKDKKIWALEN